MKDFPTKEELEKYKTDDGKYSLGEKDVTYAPLPDDDAIYPKNPFVIKPKYDDDILKGLGGTPSEKKAALSEVDPSQSKIDSFMSKEAQKDKKKEVQKKDTESPVDIMISMSKKEEVSIDLKFNAKIPVQGFFGTMDNAFVNKNKNAILSSIIENIKMTELEKQLKEKLKNFYGI